MRCVKNYTHKERQNKQPVVDKSLQTGAISVKAKTEKLPNPLKLRGGFIPTTEEIEEAIAEGLRY
jgi:hypothetical protein